jgi:hypothetical protein
MPAATADRVEQLKRTVETKSSRAGHELGPWAAAADWTGALVARCGRCEEGAEVRTSLDTAGQRRHEYRALTDPCPGEPARVRAERALRARFEWAWLRAGEPLPGGHALGGDLEVRIWRSTGREGYDRCDLPLVYAAVDLAGRMYGDGSGGAQGKGLTVDLALDDLRAQLVRHLVDFDRRVAEAVRIRDRYAAVVRPPLAGVPLRETATMGVRS